MTELNKQLLASIDNIEDVIAESELSVMTAIGNGYAKMALISEFAQEDMNVNEFEIFQEGHRHHGGIIGGIKKAFSFIAGLFSSFFKAIGKFFGNIDKKLHRLRKDHRKASRRRHKRKRFDKAMGSIKDAFSDLGESLKNGDATKTVKGAGEVLAALQELDNTINNRQEQLADANTTFGQYSTDQDPTNTPPTEEPSEPAKVEEPPATDTGETPAAPETPAETPAETPEKAPEEKEAETGIAEVRTAAEGVKTAAEEVEKDKNDKEAVARLREETKKLQQAMQKNIKVFNKLKALYGNDSQEHIANNMKADLEPAGVYDDENSKVMMDMLFRGWLSDPKNKSKYSKLIDADGHTKFEGLFYFTDGYYHIRSEIFYDIDRIVRETTAAIQEFNKNTKVTPEIISNLINKLESVVKSKASAKMSAPKENMDQIIKNINEENARFKKEVDVMTAKINNTDISTVDASGKDTFSTNLESKVCAPLNTKIGYAVELAGALRSFIDEQIALDSSAAAAA